jgi:hypothetical protein
MARKGFGAKPKSQTGKDDFKSVAKALGCDDDKARFEAKLGKIAKVAAKDDAKFLVRRRGSHN